MKPEERARAVSKAVCEFDGMYAGDLIYDQALIHIAAAERDATERERERCLAAVATYIRARKGNSAWERDMIAGMTDAIGKGEPC